MKISSVSYHYNFIPNHLGSGILITDINGNPYQFFLNLPFGETFVDRHSHTGEYENVYKFNGKELDTETGLYYYGARYYNPRISQFYATDPLAEKYPNFSPYTYTADNPVMLVDPDGRKIILGIKARKNKNFQKKFGKAVAYLLSHKAGGLLIKLNSLKQVIVIELTKKGSYYDPKTHTIYWNPNEALLTPKGHILSSATILGHEASHALEHITKPKEAILLKKTHLKDYDNAEELRVIKTDEQEIAEKLGEVFPGEPTRNSHRDGKLIKVKDPTQGTDVYANTIIISVKTKNKK